MKHLLKIAVIAALLVLPLSFVQAQENYFGRSAATQATSATTAVTLNAPSAVVTTVSLTNAANATTSFTYTNSAIAAGSAVQVSINGYSGTLGTNGIPYATATAVAAGSCTLNITNVHPSNALSGTVSLGVTVVN